MRQPSEVDINFDRKLMSIFFRFANDYLWGVRYKLFAAILCGLYKFLLPVYIAWVIGNIVGILENDGVGAPEGSTLYRFAKYSLRIALGVHK